MNVRKTPALLVLALLLQLAAPCALQAQEPDRSVGNNHSIALDYYLTDTVITLSSQENEHSYYYTARDEVRLLPGFRFSAENGKVFSAKTDPALLFPPKEGEFVTQDGTLMADPFQGYAIGNIPSIPYYAVGGVPGTLTVSATGAAVYAIPIECPEGAGGLTPQLSLVYNSQSGDGLAGWGWNLSGLSAITRTGSTLYHDNAVRGIQLNSADNLMLDGQRLVLVSGTHWQNGAEYRTEVEAFSRVTYHTSDDGWFKVETRDGLTMEYRLHAELPSATGGVSKPGEWLLTRAEDANGNYMTVGYSSDAGRGEYHPTQILYGGNSRLNQGTQSKIAITYENRPDTFTCYVAGHRTVLRKRVKYIDTYHDLGQTLFRRYVLSYYAGGRYSRLSGVEEGLDGLSGMDKRQLTPIHFTWGDGVTGDSYRLDSGFVASNTVFADMDGDGLSDIVCYRPKSDYTTADSITIYHARRAPNGRIVYAPDQKVGMVKYFKELFVADFNGDGLNDLIYKTVTNWYCYYDYYTNTGGGFSHVSGESVKLDKSYDKGLVGDFDGDGRFDLLVKKECRLYDHNRNLISSGSISDWGEGIIPVYCPENCCLTDFNGNGKTEICIFCTSGFMVYEFNGVAFSELTGFQTSLVSSSDRIYPGDYNGDGLTDLLVCRTNRTFILFSTGVSFAETDIPQTLDDGDKAYTGDFNGDGLTDLASVDATSTTTLRLLLAIRNSHGFDVSTVSVDELSRSDIGTDYQYLNFVDVDVDGCDDMVCTGTAVQAPVRRFGLREPVRVTRIADALGDTTRITYAGIGGSDVCGPVQPDTYPLSVMSQPSRVVSLVESPASRVGHSYRRPLLHRRGKGFLGFMEMTSADSLSGMATTTSYALTDSHCYAYPQKRTVSTFSGIPVSSTTTSVGVRSFPGIRFAPHQSIVCQKNYLTGDSITLLLVAYDSVENPTLFNTVHGNLTETHHLSYTTAGSWCPDKIARDSVIISQGNDSQTRVTAYTYDDRGNTLTVTTDPGDAKAVTTTYGNYDFWGHARRVQVSSGGETRTATSAWSADGRFLLSETDALGQTVSYTYDTSRGLLTEKTDPAGTTTYSYDSFGRLREEVLPDGRRHAVRLLWAGGERPVQQAVWYSYEETSGESPLWTWYDALGREVCRQYYGRGEQKISVFTEYDSQGRLRRTSEPTFAASAETWAETYTYDNYGRPSSVVTPVGTTNYTYDELTTTVNSPSGTVTTVMNTAGQRQSVTTNNKTVSYAWYPSGRLKTATPQGGLPLSMEYDLQGNRTRLVDPDAGEVLSTYNGFGELLTERQAVHLTATTGAADTVTTAYSYEQGTGRLISTTRSSQQNGTQTVTYTYDQTIPSRVVSQQSSGGADGSHQRSYTYDTNGRITQVTEQYDNRTFLHGTDYDALGRIKRETYPSGYAIRHAYDRYGFLQETTDSQGNSLYVPLTSNALGQTLTERKGSTTTTYGYDDQQRLTSIQAPGVIDLGYTWNTGGLMTSRSDHRYGRREEFSYDPQRRLTGYDLYQDNSEDPVSEVWYGYDALGNMTEKSDLAGYELEYGIDPDGLWLHPHALTWLNPLEDTASLPEDFPLDNLTVTYTDHKKIRTLTQGNTTATLIYGADGERRKMTIVTGQPGTGRQTTTRYYQGNYEETILPNGTTQRLHYLPGGSVMVETVSPGNSTGTKILYYGFQDHLGSLTALVRERNGNRAIIDYRSYDAWGRLRDNDDWTQPRSTALQITDRGYTGHEHLTDFGIINMNGRVYDPLTAQFFSPDPYVQAPDSWLNYNRYAYCLDNPLIYTDPDGELFGTILTAIQNTFQNIEKHGLNFGKYDYNMTIRAWNIDKAFLTGTPLSVLGKLTWNLPNMIIGNIIGHAVNMMGIADDVSQLDGAVALSRITEGGSAFTIGCYVFGPDNFSADWRDHLFVHEYGHYIQSQWFGPFYLPVIGATSLASAAGLGGDDHRSRWFEVNASHRGSLHFDKFYGKYAEGYEKDSPDYFDIDKFVSGESTSYINPRYGRRYQGAPHPVSDARFSKWDVIIPLLTLSAIYFFFF